MRQVNKDELVWLLSYGLQRLPASTMAMLIDGRSERRRVGQHIAAEHLAGHLDRLEILSVNPEPPPFRFADVDGGSGVPATDG